MSKNYLQPVCWKNVQIEGGFWGTYLQINREIALDHQYEQLEETGRIDNFRRASGEKKGEFEGFFFNDSDVYKWLEAASYSLGTHPTNRKLENKVENLIKKIAAAQQEDGYLNTYFILKKRKRFADLKNKHELYCAGHLFEAAVAHHVSTGKISFLNVATRFADLICQTFGSDKKRGVPGHEEIELALMKLYWLTRKKRYLATAKFFIDERGKGSAGRDEYYTDEHYQDHAPFIQQKDIVGHAVRAVYLMSGAADVYRETKDKAMMDTLEGLWKNMTEKKMYLTGGIGSRHEGEAFGKNYELPNDRAYAETCAAIGNIFWNHRMLQLTGEAKYADIMERVLYNGFLSGISLNGKTYFYQNPLQSDGTHRRQSWFKCACCPSNIARLLSSLGSYFYSISREGLWVHLYGESKVTTNIDKERKVVLTQITNYPWSGDINIKVSPDTETFFTLFLRIPAWCKKAEVLVNGKYVEKSVRPGSYLPINRIWRQGDEVQLNLSMSVDFLETHPHSSNNGRLAISRGPLIYCIEAADHQGVDVFDILLSPDTAFSLHFKPDLLGGMGVLRGEGLLRDKSEWKRKLYHIYQKGQKSKSKPFPITAIPYFAWANREPGKMLVWIPIGLQKLDL